MLVTDSILPAVNFARMRVTYDHQAFWWQEYGGVTRYFVELATRIAQCDDFDVNVVAPLYINKYLRANGSLNVVGRFIPRIPKRTGRIIQTLDEWLVRRSLRDSHPDLVHETYYCKTGLAPARTPIVVTVHDMIHEKFPTYFPARDTVRERKRVSVSRADHVICVSENTRKDLLEIFGVRESKVSVVHHGCSVAVADDSSSVRSIEQPYLLYVGARTGYKNFAALLAAYASSRFLRDSFKLVCFGGEELSEPEMRLMKKCGLADSSVVMMGGDDKLLANVYRYATALVYPSLYEGFGMPVLEAMACGCPVICSNTSSLPEVGQNAAAYFDPRDAESIRSVVERIVASEVELQGLTERGKRRAKQFSWDKCAAETAEVYRKVIGDPWEKRAKPTDDSRGHTNANRSA